MGDPPVAEGLVCGGTLRLVENRVNPALEIVPGYRYFNEIGRDLGQSYLKNGRNWPWLGRAYWFANTWLDSSDPDLQGRPS